MNEVRLQDALTDFNLYEAWVKVRDNQGCAGVDGETIEAFEADLKVNLETLRNEVYYDTYRPRALLRVDVEKDSGGMRGLCIPSVRDRVLQTAVALVLTPLFEAEFEDCSFAYRKGRSVEMAVARVERLRDQGYHWVVDADITKFFDSIPHPRLKDEIEKLVQDGRILGLIKRWLRSEVHDGPRTYRLKQGVPQGSPISHLFANLYLDHLDEELLDKDLRLVRFADDFLVLCKSKQRAEAALEFTTEVLESLRLEVNEDKTRIVDFNRGFRFLGVQFIRSLAFKSKQPARISPRQSKADQTSAVEVQTATDDPPGIIRIGFNELGLAPQDFPSEPVPPEPIEPLQDELEATQRADHDPRLRTLYLLEHGLVLGKESERFVVRRKGDVVQEIPAIKVDQIMVFGNSQITTQAMQLCLRETIPIFLLSGMGRYYGAIDSFATDPVLLHRDQFARAADPAFCLQLAREFVRGKIANTRLILMRQGRKREAPALREAKGALQMCLGGVDRAQTLDELRGFEGQAARSYFGAIKATLDSAWGFHGRARQPPTDPVNALLSYGYTLMFYNVYSFARARGLNPHVGYLHPMRAGHPALISDLMEEFRAIVVDAVVWKLVFNHRLSPEDFDWPQEDGKGCFIKPAARKTFIQTLEAKFNSPIRHPVSGLQLDYRRCMEHQARHLAAVIRGREEVYRPLILR